MVNTELYKKAESGDIDAMLDVALAYYEDTSGTEETGKAYGWYKKVIEKDSENARAINGIANCLYYGDGVEQDIEKAVELYRKAAELYGHKGAQYNLARHLEQEGNDECIDWYVKASDAGDEDAPFDLACIYFDGEIIPQNIERAFEYLQLSVERNNSFGMTMLGIEYIKGEDIKQDYSKGLELFHKAYDMGNGVAAKQLAISYLNGIGVEQDINKFVEWGEKAADLGENTRGDVYVEAGKYYNQDNSYTGMEKASEWYKKAAELGHVEGMILTTTSQAVIASIDQTKPIGDWKGAINAWDTVYFYAKHLLDNNSKEIDENDHKMIVEYLGESLYKRAICYRYLKEYSTAIHMLTDKDCTKGVKEDVLKGVCLFQNDSYKEGLSYIRLIEKADYICENKDPEEEHIYSVASRILAGASRMDGDLNHAVDILDTAIRNIADEDYKGLVVTERSKYIKKLLGYKYIG